MTANQLKNHIEVDTLPTLPAIAIEAIRLMEGEHSSFDSIAELLKNDQVLAGRILHYANSSYVGTRTEVTTISRAISLLGFNTIRSLILSVSVFDCFSGKLASRQGDFVNFWLHSIGVAATAEALAGKLGFPEVEEAYLAGLVHDLGKLICYMQQPEEFEQVCLDLEKQGLYSTKRPIPLEVEERILGVNHVDVGKHIAEQWSFPEGIARVMWLHHQPVYEPILPAEENLHQLIRFADVLCVAHNIGSSYFLSSNAYDHQHYHFAMEGLIFHHKISAKEIRGIMDDVLLRVREVSNILGFCDEEIYRNLIRSANVSLGNMTMSLNRGNQQLAATNKVLDAIYKMSKNLKSDLSIKEAGQEIVFAVRDAFGVERCLCMIRDDQRNRFLGLVSHPEGIDEFTVSGKNIALNPGSKEIHTDIESEALSRLRRVVFDDAAGGAVESGVIDMVAGSQFLASFFVADRKSADGTAQIIGELMIDFQDSQELQSRVEDLRRSFEMLSAAAGNALERILLEKRLQRQARKMADASRRMEESQRQLFHSHRLATVGRLAAGAAHEINNPLTIVSLNLQILERMLAKENADPGLLSRLKIISDQEQRISKIVSELMSFARPSQPKFGEIGVAEVANKVLKIIGDRISMAKVSVENKIVKDLPNIYVDAMQIEQVFMNLLINANQSMPDGGTITLEAVLTDDEMVSISVTDQGVGIAKEDLGKIFDPFFTTKKEGEGTGLGLAICHSIIEHNGGSMEVESQQGVGTTFRVYLPIDRGSRLRALKKAVDQTENVSHEAKDACRILVVDDERVLNDMLRDCLETAGYQVDGAYDGVEGIGLLRYKKYHLMLLDIRMPRKDGLEVLKFVREEYPEMPVIIVTGLASMDEIKETVKMGAHACIKKPFRLEKVLERVSEALKDRCTTIPNVGI